jgi:hypothetical protein
MDQLARADDLRAKLELSDWDLIVVDEAHKMSASWYGNEFKPTKRYRLYTICERKGWAEDAGIYNALVISWHAILESSRGAAAKKPVQGELL